jgi:hypothetical protein
MLNFFNVITPCEFFICYEIIPWFLQGSNIYKLKLENTEGAIKNGQSRETGNKGHTIQRKTQHTPCVENRYTQIRHEPCYKHLEVKNEPNIVSMRKS